jgi:spore coat protein U-like protein
MSFGAFARFLARALACGTVLVWAGAAMGVSCGASVPVLSFGSYNVFASTPVDSATSLSVSCTRLPGDPGGNIRVNYIVTLGTGSSGSYAQRMLRSGAETLGYNLYNDSSRALVWGDGNGGSQVVTGSMNLSPGNPSRVNTHTIYGRVPARQDVAAGNYADAILVTITY